MPTETAPAAAQAAAAAPAAPADPFEAAVSRIEAREEAAVAGGKGTPAADGSGGPAKDGSASSAAANDTAKPRSRAADLGAIAQREWAARQREEQAKTVSQRYAPLDEALQKKDFVQAMTLLAKNHGATFADFVSAMEMGKPPEKTPAEIARETVEARLTEEREKNDKAQAEQRDRDNAARVDAIRSRCQETAEKGVEGDPERWTLSAFTGQANAAWDIIEGHYNATTVWGPDGKIQKVGEKLSIEQALDLIETKLKEKWEARRPKQSPVTGGAAGNGRNEAAGQQRNDGRAAVPSFTNRATSGMPAVVGNQPVDEAGLPEHEAISRVAARVLNLRL